MEVQDRTFNPSEAKPISTEGGLISGKLIDEWGLIAQGYDKQKALQRSSYDLHLGDYHCVTNKKGEWEYLFIGEEKDAHYLSFDLPIGDSHAIIIPPFGSAIIQLNECIDTLSVFINRQILVAGRFDLKLSTIYKGLISQQATQVEPCYYGRLFCFVHNLSSKEIHLKHKDKVATIEFLRICSEGTDYDEEKEKYIAGLVEMTTAEGTQETNKYCVKGSFTFDKTVGCDFYEEIEKELTGETYHIAPAKFEKIGMGIENVSWFKNSGRLPRECGLTPIHNKVTNEMQSSIDSYLGKAETIEQISQMVKPRLAEKSNLAKAVVSFLGLLVSIFFANYLLDVRAELNYFKEELSVYAAQESGNLSAEVIARLEEHSSIMRSYNEWHGIVLLAAIVMAAIAACVIYFCAGFAEKKRSGNRSFLDQKMREDNLQNEKH